MKTEKTSQLYDRKLSVDFYEDRYEQGYMDDWPIEKKRKIFEIIQELQLPATGEALDYGCGNGVLAEIIRNALPSWKVYGTDISQKALANGRMRYPSCTFFESNSPDYKHKKFDFIFTHHVFEHVYNLSEVFNQMNEYLKFESHMLHILPCGNEGSYERNICLLRKGGINSNLGNRFFFEDEGHVRRLTTDEFCNLCNTKDFQLQKAFYANQYYGAIDWITNSNFQFIRTFSDSSKAINKEARQKLKKIHRSLILITALRLPARVFKNIWSKRKTQFKRFALILLGFPLYLFSKPFDKFWEKRAREEWNEKKYNQNGSEMYLYFRRGLK